MSSPLLLLSDTLKRREQAGVAFELDIPEFILHTGQFVAITGDSGCGKSTLLDLLALVSRPTRCQAFFYLEQDDNTTRQTDIRALWENQDEAGLAALRRSHLGYVLQTGGLLPFLSVRQNIRLPAQLNGQRGDGTLLELAGRLGIAGILDKKPQYLSGGQRQRVAILRAIFHHPRLVLADEPTAAVDKQRAHAIVQDFSALAKEHGTTVVMVTHDRELVRPFADFTYTFEVSEVSETLTRSVCKVQT